MIRLAAFLVTLWLSALSPPAVWACVYPAPMRSVNTILLEALNANGTLANPQRVRLRQAMSQLSPGALGATLAQEVSRGDARAAAAVLAAAGQLADGIGRVVDPDLRGALTQVRDAIHQTCAQDNAVQTGTGADATDAERGQARNEGSGGRGLSFGEGVVRLSMTFTIYMAFLGCLLGFRQFVKAGAGSMADPGVHGSGESAPPGSPPLAGAPPSPGGLADATLQRR